MHVDCRGQIVGWVSRRRNPPFPSMLENKWWVTPRQPTLRSYGNRARQFNTRLPSGLSSEKVGTSISKRSPLSLTIW